MFSIFSEIRYALRGLRRTPAFTIVALAVLALGIGANTAVFSLINAVLLRPLPFADPDKLVEICERGSDHDWSVAYPDFVDWRRQATAFENMAITHTRGVTLAGLGEAEKIQAAFVSANFLSTLKARPLSGRDFLPEDDVKGAPGVAILSHAFWQSHFGGERSVLGKTFTVDRRSYTVTGVLGPEFRFHRSADVYLPFSNCIEPQSMEVRGNHNNNWVIARLKQGVSVAQARTQMDTITQRLAAQYPETNTEIGASLRPLRELMVGGSRESMLVLFGAVVFVLLIACTNLANLLLARSAARRREVAIRTALGAGRGRLVATFLMESVLLSCGGGAIGLLVANAGFEWAARMLPWGFEVSDVRIDSAVLAFAFVVSLLTGIVFGLVPALRASSVPVSETMKEGGRAGAGKAHTRLRGALVVAEVAMSLVLMAGAGLLIRSFHSLMSVDAGFKQEHVLAVEVSWANSFATSPRLMTFQREALERFRSLPGVRSVGGVWPLPLSGHGASAQFYLEGKPTPPRGHFPEVSQHVATPEYFKTMGIPLLKGRLFTEADGKMPVLESADAVLKWMEDASLTAVVSQSMARRYWPDEDPVGKRFRLGTTEIKGPWMTVVGVVGDTRNFELESAADPHFYFLADQMPRVLSFVIRADGDPAALAGAVRNAVREIDRNVPVTSIRPMESVVADSVSGQHLKMILLGAVALLALVLAALGIYGVMAYTVSQRTHEIGVRMALGAARTDVLGMVTRQAVMLAGTGVAIGLVGALALTRLLSSLLFGIKSTDPVTFGAASALLMAVSLVASYWPARRAARVDPIQTLRSE